MSQFLTYALCNSWFIFASLRSNARTKHLARRCRTEVLETDSEISKEFFDGKQANQPDEK